MGIADIVRKGVHRTDAGQPGVEVMQFSVEGIPFSDFGLVHILVGREEAEDIHYKLDGLVVRRVDIDGSRKYDAGENHSKSH